MALGDYCADLKNYFVNDFDKDIHLGEYTISGGSITLDFLDENQYFRICGSKFNDGVYQYNNKLELSADETFKGTIWAMSIPPEFIDTVKMADDYLTLHPNATAVQSESFGGYSYTRFGSGSSSVGFEYLPSVIAKKLNRYRKMRVI